MYYVLLIVGPEHHQALGNTNMGRIDRLPSLTQCSNVHTYVLVPVEYIHLGSFIFSLQVGGPKS